MKEEDGRGARRHDGLVARVERFAILVAVTLLSCSSAGTLAAQAPAREAGAGAGAPAPEEVRAGVPEERPPSPIALAFVFWSIGEILIPDVRWEADDTSGVSLTWPIVATLWAGGGGRWGLGLGIEPQYSFPDEAWRGAAFGQVSYFFDEDEAAVGVYNQSGYLIGEDGNGPFTSLGLAYGLASTAQIGVLGRIGRYDGQTRFEIGLDVQLHWSYLWLEGAL